MNPEGIQFARNLEIKAHSEANLARAECPRRNQERVEKCLTLRRRRSGGEGVEVYELCTEAEYGFVQHVIELNYRTQAHTLVQTKFARDIQVEKKQARARTSVARQIS